MVVSALKGGTICNMHHYWAMGVGPMSAITAGRYFRLVGLAILIVAVSFFGGGLLQKASSVTARNSVSSGNLTANAVQQLPQGTLAL